MSNSQLQLQQQQQQQQQQQTFQPSFTATWRSWLSLQVKNDFKELPFLGKWPYFKGNKSSGKPIFHLQNYGRKSNLWLSLSENVAEKSSMFTKTKCKDYVLSTWRNWKNVAAKSSHGETQPPDPSIPTSWGRSTINPSPDFRPFGVSDSLTKLTTIWGWPISPHLRHFRDRVNPGRSASKWTRYEAMVRLKMIGSSDPTTSSPEKKPSNLQRGCVCSVPLCQKIKGGRKAKGRLPLLKVGYLLPKYRGQSKKNLSLVESSTNKRCHRNKRCQRAFFHGGFFGGNQILRTQYTTWKGSMASNSR